MVAYADDVVTLTSGKLINPIRYLTERVRRELDGKGSLLKLTTDRIALFIRKSMLPETNSGETETGATITNEVSWCYTGSQTDMDTERRSENRESELSFVCWKVWQKMVLIILSCAIGFCSHCQSNPAIQGFGFVASDREEDPSLETSGSWIRGGFEKHFKPLFKYYSRSASKKCRNKIDSMRSA